MLVRGFSDAPARHPAAGAVGVSTAFATFGELLQGVLPGDGGDFLVTLPIARWTVATYRVAPDLPGVEVRPAHKRKAVCLAEAMLAAAAAPAGGVLTLSSKLPEGKGLATSSTDLVATARAVANALGVAIAPDGIERFLRRIEPTDGVLYAGIVAFDHRGVRLRRRLGSLPTMTIVGVDEGGTVDTVAFNRIAKPFSPVERQEYAGLFHRLAHAVAARDLAAVGAVATRSACMNQALRPKRTLPGMLGVCAEVGALGVVAAHSGTMLGVLLDPRARHYARQVAAAARACAALGGEVAIFRTLSFD